MSTPTPGGSAEANSDLAKPDAKTTDGRTARRAVSRQRIEQAATDLFAELGYNGSTLDDIAQAAGVSKGTIFYNYKNKAELFEQLLMGAVSTLAADVQAAREGVYGWAAFELATLAVIERVDENPAPAQIVMNELFRTGRPWADTLGHARAVLVGPLGEVMREVAAERIARRPDAKWEFPPEHFSNLAMSVFGALVVATLDRRAFAPERTNEEIHQVLAAAVSGLRGLPRKAVPEVPTP